MGVFDKLRGIDRLAQSAATLPPPSLRTRPRTNAYATPFKSGDSSLEQVIVSDIMDLDTLQLTREQALQVPGVAGVRARLLGDIATKPLRDYGRDGLTEKQPAWLSRTNGPVGPVMRMMHTLDDHLFHGHSLWLLERNDEAADSSGRKPIADAMHWPLNLWRIDPDDRRIQIRPHAGSDDWFDADADQVLYIPSASDGFLTTAKTTIVGALSLERSWIDAADLPVPAIILREKEENGLSTSMEHLDFANDEEREKAEDDEIDAVIRQVAEARRSRNGRVFYVPYWLEAEVVGEVEPTLLTEGRNAARLDIANHAGLPATAVDAALPKASLNYQTQEGNRTEVADRLPFWTAPIEEALSMDGVTPSTRRVRFDFTGTYDADTGPHMED